MKNVSLIITDDLKSSTKNSILHICYRNDYYNWMYNDGDGSTMPSIIKGDKPLPVCIVSYTHRGLIEFHVHHSITARQLGELEALVLKHTGRRYPALQYDNITTHHHVDLKSNLFKYIELRR